MNRYYYNKRYIMEDYNKGEGFNLKDGTGIDVKKIRGNDFAISNIV